MAEMDALLEKYLEASRTKDVETMASCWHEDCEGIHPLRPDRNWSGLDGFLRVWGKMWDTNPTAAYEVVSTATTDDGFYLEARIELPDGTVLPSVNVFDVDGGKIRRVRVYTDLPSRDGVAIDDFIAQDRTGRVTPTTNGADWEEHWRAYGDPLPPLVQTMADMNPMVASTYTQQRAWLLEDRPDGFTLAQKELLFAILDIYCNHPMGCRYHTIRALDAGLPVVQVRELLTQVIMTTGINNFIEYGTIIWDEVRKYLDAGGKASPG